MCKSLFPDKALNENAKSSKHKEFEKNSHDLKNDGESMRIARLLRMVQEIRLNPHQSINKVWETFNISKTQFYKDRQTLEKVGFSFNYTKTNGFTIIEDKLSPITGLSLSDRLFLMFALENLCSSEGGGEGHIAAMAVEVGRKLAGGLESPFKEQLEKCFDEQVMEQGFQVSSEVLTFLRESIITGQRVRIYYQRSADWSLSWREVDPRRIYLRNRTLYLYARTADETKPKWKVFRLSRIKDFQKTGMSFAWKAGDDDEFEARQGNAFSVFMGDTPRKVSIRFTGSRVPYILERKWHKSEKIIKESESSIIWTVRVAVPEEVIRWARQFGSEAEILEVEDFEKD